MVFENWPVEIQAAVLGSAITGLGIIVWRLVVYLHNKEHCFQALKSKVEQLEDVAGKSASDTVTINVS